MQPKSTFRPRPPKSSSFDPLWLALLGAVVLGGCKSWEETKADYVKAVNEFLHHRYPADHASGDLSQIERLYTSAVTGDESWRRSKTALLEEFGEIVRVSAIIEHLEPYDENGPAGAILSVQIHGKDPSGQPHSRFDEIEAAYTRVGDDWKIAREALLSTRRVKKGSVTFTEESARSGVNNVANIDGVIDRHGRQQKYPAGSGVAVGDVDGDDFDDLYFVNGDDCQLFRNLGDGTFENVTESSGTSARGPGKARSALIADFDNDGRADIFVSRLDGPNILYRQNADGTFTDVAEKAGLTPTLESTSCCFADFDADGNLDLYIVNGANISKRDPDPIYNALNGEPNVLFMGNGDGTFTERSREAGVDHTGFGLSCAASDYDGDGDVDLFVTNDFGFDVLYRNRGDGTFEDVTDEAGVTARRASMSASWGDVDGDGAPDLFVGGMISNSKWMIDQPGYPSPAPWFLNLLFRNRVLDVVREMMAGNVFYKNNGDGTFSMVAPETRNTGWSWSSLFLDYDNDSRLDLYVLNGFISGEDRFDL